MEDKQINEKFESLEKRFNGIEEKIVKITSSLEKDRKYRIIKDRLYFVLIASISFGFAAAYDLAKDYPYVLWVTFAIYMILFLLSYWKLRSIEKNELK